MSVILAFIAGLGLPTIIFTFVATHPDETEKWLGIIFGWLSKIWSGFKYKAIKYDIQSGINLFVKSLNKNSATNFPKVVIKWAGRDQEEVIWEEGRLLLVLRDRKHNTKNFVHASYLFVSETLLRRSKVHITKSQKISLDLFSTKVVLEKESPGSLEYFVSNYLLPELSKRGDICDLLKQYHNIQSAGLFLPVLIQELTFLGNTVYLERPSAEIVQEVKALIDFLESFSQRQVGDRSAPETFTGKYIRCAIRIVATRAVVEANRIEGRRQIIASWVEAGYPNIYLIGGRENKRFMEDVVAAVRTTHPNVEVIRTYEYPAVIKFKENEKRVVQDILIHLHCSEAVRYFLTEQDLTPFSLRTEDFN